MSSLHELYLDTLVSVRPVLGDEVKQVYLQTGLLEEDASLIRLYEVTPHPVAFHETKLDVRVRPVTNLPVIEAREVLLRLVVGMHIRVNNLTESRGYTELCRAVGCLQERTVDIAERWRKLAVHTRIDELPYYGLETRPNCKICGGIVATGAGWNPTMPGNKTQPDYQPDVHHECKRYAVEVMLPLVRAQRRRAAKLAAKELDK